MSTAPPRAQFYDESSTRPPPLSRAERWLITFLNLPFALVMPPLIAIIMGSLWHMSHYMVPANALSPG